MVSALEPRVSGAATPNRFTWSVNVPEVSSSLAVQLDEVSGAEKVIDAIELLPHSHRGHHHCTGAPQSGDVLFGEVVVMGMGEEDVVSMARFGYSPGIYVDLHIVPTDSDRGLPKPGNAFQEVAHSASLD